MEFEFDILICSNQMGKMVKCRMWICTAALLISENQTSHQQRGIRRLEMEEIE